jgi:thiol:disulfide interchange protein DsbD
MRYSFLIPALLLSLFWSNFAMAQTPVKWSFSAEHVQGDEYDLLFTANIESGWYVYSMYLPSEDGPVATAITLESKHQKSVGKATESTSKPEYKKSGHDETFNMTLTKYKHDATYVQRVKCTDLSKPVTGYLTFMTCNDDRCLPPTDPEFSIDLSKVARTDKSGTDPEKKNEVKPDDKKENDTGNKENDKLEPVQWSFRTEKLNDSEYNLIFSATIDEGWHIYSQNIKGKGPVPTSLTLEANSKMELIGKAVESTSAPANRSEGMDKTFNMKLIKFKKDYTLTQKVKLSDTTQAIKGFVNFMSCDKDKCLPPKAIDFAFFEKEAPKADVKVAAGIERTKIKESLAIAMKSGDCATDALQSNMSLWMIFIFGFLGGLFALMTPCVFPMVPLTVSFFTKRSKSRADGIKNALIYGLSIIVIYVVLGMSITIIFGDNALNWLSTHWIPNTIFFVLFVAFAISFFGYYDIKLPSSWSNNTDRAADRGGLIGIFFMAFTLSLVSFSCTGPIIGTLLVQAAEGGRLAPAIGMFGFSLALALPFGLFSAFPGWLNQLPKSGGWMNTIKVVLGFVELALAFKFLSKADLTMHWGVLKYESYLVVTVLCALGMGLYLIGLIRFPHDDKGVKTSIAGYASGILSIALAAYLSTGFMVNEKTKTYATPGILSGIAPPACYSYFCPCDCPAGIQQCFHDYEEGMAYARSVNKPVMVDFTGHGCENCRKMEDNVWVNEDINKYLNEDFVLISLYVDDRTKLDSVEIAPDGSKIRNVGNKWAAFERLNFAQQSQPLYVLMAPDETVLNAPRGNTPDVKVYRDFLQCGLDNYEKWKKEKK